VNFPRTNIPIEVVLAVVLLVGCPGSRSHLPGIGLRHRSCGICGENQRIEQKIGQKSWEYSSHVFFPSGLLIPLKAKFLTPNGVKVLSLLETLDNSQFLSVGDDHFLSSRRPNFKIPRQVCMT
jgi:hypothetical protein